MTLQDMYPLVVFGVLVAWGSSIAFWNVVQNTTRKKQLMDDYAHQGIEVTAVVVSQRITSHRMYVCIETRKTHRVAYSYRANHSTCYKVYEKSLAGCYTPATPFPPSFTVKILPGFPLSAVPEIRILDRENEFGSSATVLHSLLPLVFLIIGIISIVTGVMSSKPTRFEITVEALISLLLTVPSGLAFSSGLFRRWRTSLLDSGICESSTAGARPPLTTSEPSAVIEEGDDDDDDHDFALLSIPENC